MFFGSHCGLLIATHHEMMLVRVITTGLKTLRRYPSQRLANTFRRLLLLSYTNFFSSSATGTQKIRPGRTRNLICTTHSWTLEILYRDHYGYPPLRKLTADTLGTWRKDYRVTFTDTVGKVLRTLGNTLRNLSKNCCRYGTKSILLQFITRIQKKKRCEYPRKLIAVT